MADTALKLAEPGIGSDAVEATPEIRTSSGQVILVDAADHAELSRYTWCLDGCGYVMRTVPCAQTASKCTSSKMHREIMGLVRGDAQVVDHVNGNPLDNRRANLRLCTPAQNQFNATLRKDSSSGIKGVRMAPNGRDWHAVIAVNGRNKHLGTFRSAEDAREFRELVAEMLHGEFVNHGAVRVAA